MWQKSGCHNAEVPYLGEGQTVFVSFFVFQLKVIESFALRGWLWQRLDDLDKVGGEKAMDATHLPMVPVLIHLSAQDDDVTLTEFEVSWFFAVIVIQGLGTRKLWYTLKCERKSLRFVTPESRWEIPLATVMYYFHTVINRD